MELAMPRLSARSPSLTAELLAARVDKLESDLSALRDLLAVVRFANELAARHVERLSPAELDYIARHVFQAFQTKMAHAWQSPAKAASQPLAAVADSPIMTKEQRARIAARQLERQARRELKRHAKASKR